MLTSPLRRCLNRSKLSLLSRSFYHAVVQRNNNINWSRIALLTGLSVSGAYVYLQPQTVSLDTDSVKGLKHYSTSNTEPSKSSMMLLSDDDVNAILHKLEQSVPISRQNGIIRYDVSQLPSNNPIEDNHVEQIITTPPLSPSATEDDLYFFGIFDGHSGPFTSAKLSTDLVKYVASNLNKLYDSDSRDNFIAKFNDAIESAFLNLDQHIVNDSLKKLFTDPTKENMVQSLPAISGSCALLSVYNSLNSTLSVAVTGDSRALLCNQIDDHWTVQSLSTDQTGDNLQEVERIKNEHPNEPNCVRNGRVLGTLQPSRAFGDYRYKVKEIDGKPLNELPDHLKIYFRKEPKFFLTPPYVTAKPEITTSQIDLSKSKFMVMGSDGLFELLSNEEIAGLVIEWMEKNMNKQKPKLFQSKSSLELPLVEDISLDKESQRPAFRYQNASRNPKDPKFLLQDTNVATHLIRNALSAGGSKEYVSTLVSIPSPMSRKYRDDLTVTVVFFGEEDETSVNSTSTISKPKL